MKKNVLLTIISIIVTLIFVEIFLIIFIKNDEKIIDYQRYLLYEEGKVFKNIDDKIFKFHPNLEIVTENFYNIDGEFLKESSYILKTNNFGLVQANDIKKDIPSILFVGDSFTQGQGDFSWINKFGGKYLNYQIVNGGIMGTSPHQFKLIEKHISKEYNIKKLIVIYLGEDLRREYFIHNQQRLDCLKSHKNCIGNESFYGFPLKKNPEKFLQSLYEYRVKNNKDKSFKKLRRNFKESLISLNIIKYPSSFLKKRFYKSKNVKILKNFNSFEYLNNKYKNNIIFIQLKTKNEIINKTKIYESVYAEKFLKNLTNKHFTCDFNDDLNLFYKYDGHPNTSGYQYLYNCVKEIMDNNLK